MARMAGRLGQYEYLESIRNSKGNMSDSSQLRERSVIKEITIFIGQPVTSFGS